MQTIEQIRALMGCSVSECRLGVRGAWAIRRDLERIIGFTDDELLDALSGGERALRLLLGPPNFTAEIGGQAGVPLYFADLGFMMDLDFFCTAEAVRRGLPEPSPWEIRTIYRPDTGLQVWGRMDLVDAGLVLLTVKYSTGPTDEYFAAGALDEEDYDDDYLLDEGGYVDEGPSDDEYEPPDEEEQDY
jgi:hypothetical protein